MQHDACEIRTAVCTIGERRVFLHEIQQIAQSNNTHIICFNAGMIAGKPHATAAVTHAIRSFKQNTMISNTLEMEALLFAAGSRQCAIASSFGVHEGENHLLVCCYPACDGIWKALDPFFHFMADETEVIDAKKQERLMHLFSISPGEIEALGGGGSFVDLVLERVALLEVLR